MRLPWLGLQRARATAELICGWNGEGEGATDSDLALDPDAASMGQGHHLAEREAQAR